MKRTRPSLDGNDLLRTDTLLTTADVARLLRVHPKHVYRLLRKGLPAHRVGGEWRFLSEEVLRWSGAPPRPSSDEGEERARPLPEREARSGPSPLVAANGDLAIEYLLARLTARGRPLFGLVQTDWGGGLELLRHNDVLATGCHGDSVPGEIDGERLAFLHLVDREVVLACRRGVRPGSLAQITHWKLASRPKTAGVRGRFDDELRKHGVDPDVVHTNALLLPSHREVACAVARGDVDVGLASRAWADRVGLECVPIFREAYGLLVRANMLGDPRLVELFGTVQTSEFRRELTAVRGYESRLTGTISYEPPRSQRSRGASPNSPSPRGRHS
jgi:excisionase family DNA binding protein